MSHQKRDHMWSSFQEGAWEEKMGELVSRALRDAHGKEASPVKKISKRTGIAPTTIRKWYTSRKPPSIGHFVMLARNYPEVLKAFLEISGHGYLTEHVRAVTALNDETKMPLSTSEGAILDVPKRKNDVPINMPSERQLWFLILLRRTGDGRAEDITEEFGVSLKTAKRDIGELKLAGKIRFVGAKKTGRYEIIED